MNHFGVGYAENLKNGCNSRGEAIILNPSRRDTIIHYFNIHYSFKFQIAQQSDTNMRGKKRKKVLDFWDNVGYNL